MTRLCPKNPKHMPLKDNTQSPNPASSSKLAPRTLHLCSLPTPTKCQTPSQFDGVPLSTVQCRASCPYLAGFGPDWCF